MVVLIHSNVHTRSLTILYTFTPIVHILYINSTNKLPCAETKLFKIGEVSSLSIHLPLDNDDFDASWQVRVVTYRLAGIVFQPLSLLPCHKNIVPDETALLQILCFGGPSIDVITAYFGKFPTFKYPN